jgi:hypothetical protein
MNDALDKPTRAPKNTAEDRFPDFHHDPGRPILQRDITHLETAVAMANRRIDELVDRLADTNTRQLEVNEAWANWIDGKTDGGLMRVRAALRESLK